MCSEQMDVVLMFMILRKLAKNCFYQKNFLQSDAISHPKSVKYKGGFGESLNTFTSLEPLGAEQANNPHVEA